MIEDNILYIFLNRQADIIRAFVQNIPQHIYFMYGNRVLLEGRPATICYVNQDPQNGCITLARNHYEYHLPLGALSQVYDIGRII